MPKLKWKWYRPPSKPSPTGRVLARCIECEGLAVANGDRRPVTIKHLTTCSEYRY